MRSRIPGILFLIVLAIAGLACWLAWPAAGGLSPASFRDLPGWDESDARPALAAFRRSCAAILATPGRDRPALYAGVASDWRTVCKTAQAVPPDKARSFFEAAFSVFEIRGEALFTGYYEALLRGSRTRHGTYQTPVYALPRDLVSVDLGAFRPEMAGEHIEGRLAGRKLVPYATRAEIDAVPPQAPVLFYGDDPVAVFFLHIQGSGRVLLDDGSTVRVGFAGQNGRPYTAIGRTLIRSGALSRETVSMQAIRTWLKDNPAAARQVMETDASYIFFRETPVGDSALGGAGTEGVALTPGASIAVDPRIHMLGAPFYIAASKPGGQALDGLFVAQDTGGAIRGAARADIFFGFGREAEELAGALKSKGRLFVLLPNDVAAKLRQ